MKIKIAVIEDEAAIREMYVFKLEHDGFEVQAAQNGEEGLVLCENFKPDIILLDLRMPVMSGDEMLKKLRETDWGSHIRVVVLTNISRDEAPAGLRLLNVDRYIVKAHTTPAQVVETVEAVFGQRTAAQQQ